MSQLILTPHQQHVLEMGYTASAAFSAAGALGIVTYIVARMVTYTCGRKKEPRPLTHRDEEVPILQSDFSLEASELIHRERTKGPSWILVWYGELLVLSLAMSDLLAALWYITLTLTRDSTQRCPAWMAFMGTMFEPASVLWVCCITVSVTLLVRKSQSIQTPRSIARSLVKHYVGSSIVSWGVPLIMAVSFDLLNAYGRDGLWCWVKPSRNRMILIGWYLPIAAAFVFCLGMMVYIWHLNRRYRLGLSFRLVWYIPVFLLIWLPTIIETAVSQLAHRTPSFALVFLSAVALPSQGVFNAMVWGWMIFKRPKYAEAEHFQLSASHSVDQTTVDLFGTNIQWFVTSTGALNRGAMPQWLSSH